MLDTRRANRERFTRFFDSASSEGSGSVQCEDEPKAPQHQHRDERHHRRSRVSIRRPARYTPRVRVSRLDTVDHSIASHPPVGSSHPPRRGVLRIGWDEGYHCLGFRVYFHWFAAFLRFTSDGNSKSSMLTDADSCCDSRCFFSRLLVSRVLAQLTKISQSPMRSTVNPPRSNCRARYL